MTGSILGALVTVTALPVAAGACYLLTLATASLFTRPKRAAGEGTSKLAVLIPAHNEAELIGKCVQSLTLQTYPRHLYRVVVIADNCTDATAAAAESVGAEVLVRCAPERGKGFALRWAMDQVVAEREPPDAIIVVDADAIADPDFLRQLEAVYRAGHEVIQADDILLAEGASMRARLEAAALVLRNRVRFAGRAALGLPAALCGNGMLISRQVLESRPWDAYSAVEDGEYSYQLAAAGIFVAFAQHARVAAVPTATARGAYTQALRWEGGRAQLRRTWAWRLLRAAIRQRSLPLIGTAADLMMPPLVALTATAVLGAACSWLLFALGLVKAYAVVPWTAAAAVLPVYVLTGLVWCRASAETYKALLLVPWFMLHKLRIYAHLLRGTDATRWIRTQRAGES